MESVKEPVFTPRQWRYLFAVGVTILLSILAKHEIIDTGKPAPVITPILPPEFFEAQKQQMESIKRLEQDVLKALIQMPPAVKN